MRITVSSVAVWCGLSALVCACSAGAGGKDAGSALEVASLKAPPSKASSGADAAPERAEGEPGSPKPSGSTPAAPVEDTAIRKASRPPLDLLSAPNVTFILNFSESEAGVRAKAECEEQFGDDPRESRACIAKARSKVAIEFTRFVKDEAGQWWWITYNRYKGNLLKWHKIQFTPGEETAESIVIKPFGKDKGIAPMASVPRSVTIDFPNDYSIVVDDREYGKLVFDAKIGLMESE